MILEEQKNWWRESRFGMFIHWGLYSLLERGEWVMFKERIPVKEYEKLAKDFNPVSFDADQWVKIAKEAGMKYIVITVKHHDGFSMFKTKVSPFNIVDATPYGREVLKDLANACAREGLKLCFYYSHVREWRHPHAQSLEMQHPSWCGNFGNFWDYPDEGHKNLQIYIDEFDKPQLEELLTQYGPIGIIWFDTPSLIRPDQAKELVDTVRKFQPDCLVNSRVSDDESVDYDYLSLGDCEIPQIPAAEDWETPMTICGIDWGYSSLPDNKYRSPKELIHQLVNIASLGGNYLLNVGPTAEGVIPEEAVERLGIIGKWMSINSKAIYGTQGSPFEKSPSWGRITYSESILYLHVYEWQKHILLYGLKNKVKSCYLLKDTGCSIQYKQCCDPLSESHQLEIALPDITPDQYCTVIVVEMEGIPDVDQTIMQDESGIIQLSAVQASIHKEAEDSRIRKWRTGAIKDWFHTEDWLSWDFITTQSGQYNLKLSIWIGYGNLGSDYEHEIEIMINDQKIRCRVEDEKVQKSYGQPLEINMGSIMLEQAAHNTASIKAVKINKKNLKGFSFYSLKIAPVEK